MANRLQHETSPYLLQHAHNPVDWYPWGEEALARARAEDKPILLSVGYSACHWCHVMERESFEDARVAALMNERFVCVKVDREERPDLDAVYMQATLTLNRGHGGWPMNVFLTPDLEPFFAGTYFPPEDRFGMPSWTTILLALSERWTRGRAELVRAGRTLADLLREGAAARHEGAVPPARIDEAARELEAEFDPRHGGFGPAPKFPRPEALALLLRQHRRTGEARPLEMVVTTLEHMARGGIYDQLAGGFARYATDARWLVPHFEKMLYDNALLARIYLAAWQLTGAPLLERVARETLDYLARDMTSPEGALYSATDADSEGEEGKFFVWTPAEVAAVLEPEAARAFCAAYDVSEGGNWEGKSVLWLPRPLGVVAAELGVPLFELEATLAAARARLHEARARRVPPALDDKVLTGWNALAIGAYADGWRALGDRRYLTAATRAADFLLGRMVREDGGLHRSYRDGRARFAATLEDYAYLADALVDLFEASGRRRYLGAATVVAERLVADFADPEGGFYLTASGEEAPLLRYREGHDGATPAPNAIAAQALARLAVHLASSELREVARRAVCAYGAQLARAPRAFCSTLAVVDLLERGPLELALVGRPGTPAFDALWREVHRHYLPNRALAFDPGEAVPSELEPLPLLAGKQAPEGGAALFVCKDYACAAPITEPSAVAGALGVA